MQWATGSKPVVRLTGYAKHINECVNKDALIAVPATANLIAKLANGITDNAPTLCLTAALGSGKPIMLVPSMNVNMWNSPVVRRNVETLRSMGIKILEPMVEEGKAKLPPVEEVVESTIDLLSPRDMVGLRVLVTSGPTREHIDDVKYITTPSSGLTGYYIAREAAARGAEVYVVSGPVNIRYPANVNVVAVTSVVEMHDMVIRLLRSMQFHIAIFAAAPLDFYVINRFGGKISSDMDKVNVVLTRAPKIINDAKAASPDTIVIGYKAEVNVNEGELLNRALKRMKEGSWDLAIAHDVGKLGFGTINDAYYVISKDGSYIRIGPAHKRELARLILNKALLLRDKVRDKRKEEEIGI